MLSPWLASTAAAARLSAASKALPGVLACLSSIHANPNGLFTPTAAASSQTWDATHPAYCNLPSDAVLCVPATGLPANSSEEWNGFWPVEERLTLAQHDALKQNPRDTSVLDYFQWGTCMERSEALELGGLSECGEPDGPCGPELCGAANRTCPEG